MNYSENGLKIAAAKIIPFPVTELFLPVLKSPHRELAYASYAELFRLR